ncbi:hemin receptor [Roseobacter sp. YSTF-M11]|uniref:Hemin receptor n=1 Tax=Roseobacter insulae TaxID=2859783 RepID=A0A9X1JXN4_9RHOB|nr:globin family protein [Roseobacter insulae]MBW4707176.1 hemin receptor [Roseobacter insulae]
MERENIALVQETWQQVVPIADTAADLFYNRLFAIDPGTRSMFAATDMSQQKGKLLQTLAAVISNLHAPDSILRDVESLGRRHAGYGVEAHHYDSVGTALLWTLEQGLGEAWTPRVKSAWADAFGLIATQMQAGAAQHPSRCGSFSSKTA